MVNMPTETEKALYQTREFLLSVIGESPFGILGIDLEGKIIVVNHQLIEILGKNLDVDKLIGQDVEKIIEDIPELVKVINTCLKRGRKSFDLHSVAIRREKEKVFLAIKGRLITVGMLIVVEDVTVEAAAAAAAGDALKRQKEIDKAKTEFVSIASHQLRTPLTGIQWLAELLQKENLTDKGREYLSDIRTSTQRLNKLVELLLNVSRIEEGKIEISPQSIDVVNFIKKLIDNLAILYSKKRLSFTFIADEPKIIALTDVGALQTIAQAIIPNAIEYTPEGGKIEVRISAKGGSAPRLPASGGGGKKHNQTFLLTVSDTGIGIPKKDQGRMFQEFARASNAGRLKAAGMGLGLWIAKQATELLGGKIWFESEENRGTTFFVELPIKSKSIDGTKKLV